MNTLKQSFQLDRLALMLTVAGVLLGVIIASVGRIYEHDFTVHAYGIFVAFSVAGIILGVITRSTVLGRTALITSAILLIGSLGFVA